MRARLPEREPEFQQLWEEKEFYQELRDKRKGCEKFILHDGPPYANGEIHVGTALNKVLKDIVVRFASLDGYDSPYVPGWDTHGLPIELKAMKELGLDQDDVSTAELRNVCRDYALNYIDIMTDQFRRLGVIGSWDDPYITLKPEYEARQLEVFGEMATKGHVYKGLKPVYWCADCHTALAEAEIEYGDKRSPSIFVAFEVLDGKGKLPEDAEVVIWTTTPWTIPANMAIALHPELEYSLVDTDRGKLLLATELAEEVVERIGLEFHGELDRYTGRELEYVVCKHPLYDRESLVILGDHVTLEEGTGCVHTAPGHGHEDFEIGAQYDLDIVQPLDEGGFFTEDAPLFDGMFYDDANPAITKELEERDRLLDLSFITHQYAHCWRCKSPLLYRATEQWFASIDDFRERALEAIQDEVDWIPDWGETRMSSMVEERNDWCISRQRVWGVPLPVFYCNDCDKVVITEATIASVADVFRTEGSNAWYEWEAEALLPEGFECPDCGGCGFTKETDIMDVWFDSGSSHAAVLEENEELAWPADLYLEGSDQYRGWFQSSLLTAIASREAAPYRTVLTHGFVVDGKGKKMSKSVGNTLPPEDIIERYGADILRLWVSSSDYTGDIRVSYDILDRLADMYRKIRNTFRFMLGNLYDFDPSKDAVDYDELHEVDRWALDKLQRLISNTTAAYRSYQYHVLSQAINRFCTVDMSSVYLDVLKDRLYIQGTDSTARRAAQTVLYELTRRMAQLVAPILCHTAEEVWQFLPKKQNDDWSVHLTDWPEVEQAYLDEELHQRWEFLLETREEVYRVIEKLRKEKELGGTLEAGVTLFAEDTVREKLSSDAELLKKLLIVSELDISPAAERPETAVSAQDMSDLWTEVHRAPGDKCERCWHYSPTVGSFEEHPTLCERCLRIVERNDN
jgi:isoleucyl-tRNA synthetase